MKTQVLILVAAVSLVVVLSIQIYLQAQIVYLLTEHLYRLNGGADMQISIPSVKRPGGQNVEPTESRKSEELI